MDRKYAEYLLNKTKQDYNLIADDFSRTRFKIWPEIVFLLDKYALVGEKILDLGCGNGHFFEYFEGKGVDYFGVDNSGKLIGIAKNEHPSGNFQVADALSLPFPDNFFDNIFSIAVFHHIPSGELRLQFLREAKRVLKTNGVLVLIVWNFREFKEFFLLFKSIVLKILKLSKLDFGDFLEPWGDKTVRYYHYFKKGELVDLAGKAGLKVEEIGIIKNEKGNRRNTFLVAEK